MLDSWDVENEFSLRKVITFVSWDFMKKALVTGITGQDGSYLAEFLLDKGYEEPTPPSDLISK